MTVLPPGLVPPHEPRATVVVLRERAAGPATPSRSPLWSIAFIVLVVLTIVASVVTVLDLLNG